MDTPPAGCCSRRRLLGGATLPAVSLILAACGARPDASGGAAEKTPVTLWWWNEQDLLKETEDEIVRDWPQRFPHVTLQPVKVPYAQLATKMVTALAADDVPDVTFSHQDWVAPFAQKGVFRPLDDLVKKDPAVRLADYYPAAVDFHRWRGASSPTGWTASGSSAPRPSRRTG